MSYNLLPEAVSDIEAIVFNIAADNPIAAERWFDRLHDTFKTLASMPYMGTARFDVRPSLRTFAVGNYLILHRARDGGVDIVRVVHGAREWESLV